MIGWVSKDSLTVMGLAGLQLNITAIVLATLLSF